MTTSPIRPPFTEETALAKVQPPRRPGTVAIPKLSLSTAVRLGPITIILLRTTMQIEQRANDGITILDLKGRLTATDGDLLLRDQVAHLLCCGHRKLVLNLAGVSNVDSAGLGAIVSSHVLVGRQGGQLKLLDPQTRLHQKLVITQLLNVLEILDSEHEAMGSFAR